ncbi:tektin-2 [Bacillus rossius redtenbacheri]|uniref:tektin-2 n=1 Tax=Bacillus rossius redtenbacheri TaxID=93214 RepID=UPI002FDD28A3
MSSVATFEKPIRPTVPPDWLANIRELGQSSQNQQATSFELRHGGRQLRNETGIRTEWDTYHNDLRLEDRVAELSRWKTVLQQCLGAITDEIVQLKDEKAETERKLESMATALNVVAECLSLRDCRQGTDRVQDDAYSELKKELTVLDSLKNLLTNKCHAAWEQLNRLEEVEFKLQVAVENKERAISLDEENLKLDKNCSGISYKPDPLRIPPNCTPYETWLAQSQDDKLKADNEITASNKLREVLYVARERCRNDLKAQHDSTNYMLRRRIYEIRRAKSELEWQRHKTIDEMKKLMKEIEDLKEALEVKTNSLKLAETRLENRMFRSGAELVEDEGQISLKDEVLHLRQTRQDLIDKISAAKGTYNSLENVVVRLDADLANKNHALLTDEHCLDIRERLHAKEQETSATQTDRNIELSRMEHAIPKS